MTVETSIEHTRPPVGRRRWLLGAGGLALCLAVGWAVARARSAPAAAPDPAAAGRDAPRLDGELIRFSDAFARRAGVTGEVVRMESLAPLITVSGTMTYDPRRFAAVGARVPGRVRRVAKLSGDRVKAGEVIAEVESAELGRAEAQVLAARAREQAAAADMKRERRLADARISAERDAELAAATYQAAAAERAAAERAVEALGGSKTASRGVLTVRSPIDGRVVASKVSLGQTVDPAHTIAEIADIGVLWLELRVFEQDIADVGVGDRVEISPQSGEGAPLPGTVAHVGEVIDVATRTAAVRVVVDNRAGELRPGQSVVARIRLSAPARRALSIPRRAVTRIDGKPTVFVLRDKNTVEPRAVSTGAEDQARVAVVGGLHHGDQVVVEGLFAIKSEIFR